MNLTETKIAGKTIYEGKVLKLEVDQVKLSDGSYSVRECVRHSGGAAVLLVKDDNVLLVKQFRYMYGKPIYEIPAGKVNECEEDKVAANRELEEETGYKADLKHLLDIYPSPGYTDEIIHIYYAEKFEFVGQKLDNGEFLSAEFVKLDKVMQMIESGQICDAKTVAAVYKYISTLNA